MLVHETSHYHACSTSLHLSPNLILKPIFSLVVVAMKWTRASSLSSVFSTSPSRHRNHLPKSTSRFWTVIWSHSKRRLESWPQKSRLQLWSYITRSYRTCHPPLPSSTTSSICVTYPVSPRDYALARPTGLIILDSLFDCGRTSVSECFTTVWSVRQIRRSSM